MTVIVVEAVFAAASLTVMVRVAVRTVDPDTAVIATVRLEPLPPNAMLAFGTAVVLEELTLSVKVPGVESATVRFIVPPELEHIPPAATEIAGATVSIVQVKEAGVGSTLPAPSIARTSNVWLPSAKLL